MSEELVLYQCAECGLHYRMADKAQECEAFCKQHSACSLEITKYSIEVEKSQP